VWLPATGQGPFPTILFAHGIGGDRSQGEIFAGLAAQLGFAIAAIDAVQHGQHPAGGNADGNQAVMDFFAINLATLSIEALRMRDNWRQSTYDKLQFLHVLLDQPDVNGDGIDDIDVDHVVYLGISLGGIMGSELMALTDKVGAGVIEVCGGRLSQIMQDSGMFGVFLQIAVPQTRPPGAVDRFFSFAQTLMERADPANFAPWLLRKRLAGTGTRPTQVLMQVAIGDETIPNGASWYLARAMRLPQLAPVVAPVSMVAQDVLPAVGNVGAEVTGGLFQFDRVTTQPNAGPVSSAHGNTPGSAEAVTQMVHFLQTWLNDGVAEIIDPYAQLGTAPL